MRKQRTQQASHLQVGPSRTHSSTEVDEEDPPLKATERMRNIAARNRQSRKEESAVATALANRAYHLPGNGYCADLSQYMINNHHLWGLCCRHPEHPIGFRMRAINLLGSALFGLAITNLIWLGYIYFDQDPNSVLFQIHFQNNGIEETYLLSNSTNTTIDTNATDTGVEAGFELIIPSLLKDKEIQQMVEDNLQITKGMVLLWTVGACLHAAYDCAVWYAAACACCLPGNRCDRLGFLRRTGGYFIMFLVILVAAVASFAVVLRVMWSDGEEDVASTDPLLGGSKIGRFMGKYEFILSYFVEFFLTLFVYYPLFQIILFNGVLGCLGCDQVRFLGGRPFEMRQLERQQRKKSGVVAQRR